ncbi:hypothetical protein ACFQMA_14695 [Halosimplex aquaticum]|uniref:Uncharacterized protein n=1 Tax=Halosimplex aquaticum TaxID=3026162 RepID=A0ABD5Y6Y5_9EURY|nr:hypothetical protein [Halosimplex aquaticum]
MREYNFCRDRWSELQTDAIRDGPVCAHDELIGVRIVGFPDRDCYLIVVDFDLVEGYRAIRCTADEDSGDQNLLIF